MKTRLLLLFVALSLVLTGCPDHYKSGMSLVDQGQLDRAIEKLLLALEHDPTHADVYYQLGLLYLEKEEYRIAGTYFKDVVERFPSHPQLDGAYFYLGFCQFQVRKYETALNTLPLVPVSHSQSDFKERARFYEGESAWYLEEFGKAIGRYSDLVRQFPTGKFAPAGFFRLGNCYSRIGEYAEAAEAYNTFLTAADTWQHFEKHLPQVEDLIQHTYYQLGVNYSALEKPGKAIGFYRELLKTFPSSPLLPDVLYQLGDLYDATGSLQQALEVYQTLVTDHPGSEYADDALYRQGTLLYRQGDYQQAVTRYERLLSSYPDSSNVRRAYVMAGNCSVQLEQYEQAVEQYDRALRHEAQPPWIADRLLSPDDAAQRDMTAKAALWAAISAYQTGQYEKAGAFLAAVPETVHSVRKTFWNAEVAYRRQQYQEAEAAFSQVLTQTDDPGLLTQSSLGILKTLYDRERWQDVLMEVQQIPLEYLTPEAFLIAGDCALNLKDFSNAMTWYQEIRERYPHHPMAQSVLYHAGNAAYKLEKFEQARQYFSDLIRQYPENEYVSTAQFFIGWTYFREEEYRKAIKAFQLLIERFPDSPEVFQARLKIADSFFNMRRYNDAIREYQRIMREHPNHPELGEAQYGLTLVYKVTGRYEEYLAETRRFIRENPDNPLSITAQYQIGEEHFQQGDFDEAIQAYQWILDNVADNEYADNALFRIGQCYVRQNQMMKALRTLQAVLNQYPNSEFRPSAQYELANTYFRMRDFELAAKEYNAFIRSFPADGNIPQAMLNYGQALLRLGRFAESVNIFEQLLQRFPGTSQAEEAGMLVGETFLEQQRCQEAEQALAPILNGADHLRAAQAQLQIAECYESNSDFEKAVAEYLKVIYVYSDQKTEVDRATYASAQIYEQQGKIDQARNLYRKLVETSTDQALIQQAKQKLQDLQ